MRTMAVCEQTGLFGHQARTPMCGIGWHRFQGFRNHALHLAVGDGAGRADPRLIQQSVQPELPKPFPPFAYRWVGNPQLRSYRRIT
jgi:hypothetical protein